MKLGIAVKDLGPSQLGYYLTRNVNAALLANPILDITAFFENQVPPALAANFATMPMYEAWGFAGNIVATTFLTAQKAQKCQAPARKFFYVWDIEWARFHTRRSYEEWSSVYRDPALSLLARSAEHKALIESCWNRPVVAVVDDMNINQLLEAVQ